MDLLVLSGELLMRHSQEAFDDQYGFEKIRKKNIFVIRCVEMELKFVSREMVGIELNDD